MRNIQFWLVEDKIREAKFFYNKMAGSGGNVFETRCYFGAFVSSCRSITFVLQKAMKGIVGFDSWYDVIREELGSHPFSSFFMEQRNRVVHEGETDIKSGRVTQDKNEGLKILHFFSDERYLYDWAGEPVDVVTASKAYLDMLLGIVKRCENKFKDEIEGMDFFTEEALQKNDLTIEDLEQILGFPPGWTEGIPIKERLRILKAESDR